MTTMTARTGSFPIRFKEYRCPGCNSLLMPGTTAYRFGGRVFCLDCHPDSPAKRSTPNTPADSGQVQKASPAILQGSDKPGPLTERYRPRSLDSLWGQVDVVRLLREFIKSPYPNAFIFEGETGTGKTSAALALAGELGCRVDQAEYGGVWQIASGEQSADAVREMARRMWLTPLMGSGWKAVIVNECDRMARPAEMIWLDVLENLPRRTVVIFTTNDAANLSQRFRDRCVRAEFQSDAAKLRSAAVDLAGAIWKAESGRDLNTGWAEAVADNAVEGGKLSFRRVVQLVARDLANGWSRRC